MPEAIPPIDLGGISLRVIRGGALRLDGGAMFGVIPRALWQRNTPADDQHRIQLACNCVLVDWHSESARRAVIETGHGSKYIAKEQSIFAIDPARWLGPALHEAGAALDEITDVIVTHLHFDHAGGLTTIDQPAADFVSAARPSFPKARVHVQRQEFDDARANFGIMTATYREENFAPIDRANLWHLLDGEGTILPGIRALRTTGHTRGHQSILIEGRDRCAIFAGDVIPTRHHLGAPYNMGYDLLPLDNRESKRRILTYLAQCDGLLIIDHEPQTPVMRVIADKEWFRLESLG